MRKSVLGAPVDLFSRKETLEKIRSWLSVSGDRMRLVVTAYSEFYVRAQWDDDFRNVLNAADLVTPDGVSVLAATEYQDRVKSMSLPGRLWGGLRSAGLIVRGEVGETVTGVYLFEELTAMAAKNGWKVFLLGGWGGVSGRVARRLLKRFPKIKVSYDSGEVRVGTDEKKNREVIEKINRFEPDLLFVSYNPIKQEKWLAKYRGVLKAKVGIGVGGTFNEYMGEFKKAPQWMERMGLKWLWRVMIEPRRFGRIMRAVIVFPWLVFRKA